MGVEVTKFITFHSLDLGVDVIPGENKAWGLPELPESSARPSLVRLFIFIASSV